MAPDYDVTYRYLQPTRDGAVAKQSTVRLAAGDALDAAQYIRHVLADEGCEVQEITVDPAPPTGA